MVQQFTIGQYIRYLKDLPKNIENNLSITNETFMRRVKKSAKLRAPRDTASLAEDIKMAPKRQGKNVKIWKIIVDNPAAAPQEFGFTPHFAPILNSSKMKPGIYFVRKNTPFLIPAIENQLSNFPKQLNESAGRAIIKK